MIGKLATLAVAVLALRWFAVSAPTSERTLPMDGSDVESGVQAPSLQRRDSHRERLPPAPRRAFPPGRDQGTQDASASEREERLKEVGSQVWAVAKPLLAVAADKSLDILSDLLRTAADKLARRHGNDESESAPARSR